MSLEISQAAFAERTGVSRATQLAYEAESTVPDLEYLQRVQALWGALRYVVLGAGHAATPHPDWERLHRTLAQAEQVLGPVKTSDPDFHNKWVIVKHLYEIEGRTSPANDPRA